MSGGEFLKKYPNFRRCGTEESLKRKAAFIFATHHSAHGWNALPALFNSNFYDYQLAIDSLSKAWDRSKNTDGKADGALLFNMEKGQSAGQYVSCFVTELGGTNNGEIYGLTGTHLNPNTPFTHDDHIEAEFDPTLGGEPSKRPLASSLSCLFHSRI